MAVSEINAARSVGTGRLAQIYLGAVIVALVAAALYSYWMIERREQWVESFSRYNVAYSASQAVIELQRLQKAMLAYEVSNEAGDLENARLRFEVFYDRVNALNKGPFADFLAAAPGGERTVSELGAGARSIDRLLTAPTADLDIKRILAILAPLESKAITLAAEANRYGASRLTEDHRSLADVQQQFSLLSFMLIIGGLCLVGALTWHNRLLTLAHRDLSRSAGELTQAADELASANLAVANANAELRHQNQRLSEKEQALKAQNVLFDAALNNMSQGLCMFDRSLRPIVWNRQFEGLLPASVRRPTETSRPPLHNLLPDLAMDIERNTRAGRPASFETEWHDGRVVAISQRPMPGGDWVATFEDVTERRKAEARVAHMARHDVLTNLPNRYAFRERIIEVLGEPSDESSDMLAVMCVDLDNFKSVNDSLGHPIGDALLCAVAERLAQNVRDTDMVARLGGDEFAVLQQSISCVDEAERLAARLVDELCKPFPINGENVYATGSVGVAISAKHAGDPDVLQKNADLALYAAKADGKRTYRFFERKMDERLSSRRSLESDLRGALAAGELELHYQPIVHLRTMRMTGLEALLRWTHPTRGIIPPSTFIPVAEEAGFINEIGRWVLARACADAALWPSHLKVAVNLSVAQFTRGDIVEDIRTSLSRAGLRPERLIVEITESLLLAENAATLNMLNRLRAMRVGVAMDDFGTGYSSLSYLRKYAFDRIKIDRDFVSTSRGTNAAIIEAIVQLGKSLGMTTVAEGVETEADLEMLRSIGCVEGQGYLFGRPAPIEKTLELIAAEGPIVSAVA